MTYALLFLALTSSLHYEAPDNWKEAASTSRMRLAQWNLPAASGEAEAPEVIIFYFGPGGGGGVEANLERWYTQFEQPDGSATRDKAVVRTLEVGNLRITRADVSGDYVAPVRPGAAERHQKAGYRMIAAIVEGPGGPWFIRLLGPRGGVAAAEKGFDGFLETLRVE